MVTVVAAHSFRGYSSRGFKSVGSIVGDMVVVVNMRDRRRLVYEVAAT